MDRAKHLVLEAGHPSPLNRLGDFRGSRPFSRANTWLAERGLEPIEWRLDSSVIPGRAEPQAQRGEGSLRISPVK